jgi:multidrug resistance efflux pump
MSKHFIFALALIAAPVLADAEFSSINLAGTVVANNKTGLSYEARGCITDLSSDAVKSGTATAGQVLIQLDDRAANLAHKTAQVRLNDLEAAVSERAFAITVANADVARVTEEQDFVNREYERTRVLFQRGLVNETTLDTAERRKLDATFVVQRAEEALERAKAAKGRAEIALEIGQLELQARELDLEALTLRAPFDGVLLNFNPNIGDCVAQGGQAAEIYDPTEKSVETFVYVDQLVDAGRVGVVAGNPVQVVRTNGQVCEGVFSLIETEANLESQNVKAKIELAQTCAPDLFLNEAVGIQTLRN